MISGGFLTTKEVARLCRVSNATIKRWEAAGLLKSEKTSGGHRRFRAEEVARFQRKNNLGLKTSHGDTTPQSALLRREFADKYPTFDFFAPESTAALYFQALVAGSEGECADILINEYLQGSSLAKIFDETVTKPMYLIGELWMRGLLNVAQEHRATRATFYAIHKLRAIVPIAESNGKLMMNCAIEGELHELSTNLTQITLENEGWTVMNFGANTPLFSFTEEVLHYKPDLICLSATITGNVDRLLRDYREFREQTAHLKISIILGGNFFADEKIRSRFPADLYARNFQETVSFVRNLPF
jgi:MerR family transcriptional regulator, light-induced transcriptional regulator